MNILKATASFAKKTLTMARCFLPKAMLLAIAIAPLAESATDTPPNRMTVQSFITDDTGTPLGNAIAVNRKMTFFIYTADTGGDPKFADVQIVTIDKGHFSVVLGEGDEVSGQSHDLAVAFSGVDASDRFLEIQVSETDGSNPQTLSPRLRLLPSAYAFLASYANEAARVTGGGIDTAALAESSVTSDKVAPNSLTAADLGVGSVGSSEVADNSLTQADLGANSVANSEIAPNVTLSGNLGINQWWPNVTLGLRSVSSSDWLIYGLNSGGTNTFSVSSAGTIWGKGGLASNMVNSAAVVDNSLTASDLAANSVGSSEVTNNSLTQSDLAANSVGSSEIASSVQLAGNIGINHFGWGNVALTVQQEISSDFIIYGNNSSGSGVYAVNGNGSVWNGSDRRLKQDIEPIEDALSGVRLLNPVAYHFKTDPNGAKQVGFIAQEVQKIFPDIVSQVGEYLGLSYQEFGVLAIGAIQELDEKVITLEAENAELANRLAALEKLVESLAK